jgi:hypothetical protein
MHELVIIIALCWPLVAFSDSWSCTHYVGLLGQGIRRSQVLYLSAEQHKHRINAHNTEIHALSEIRAHDPIVRALDCAATVTDKGIHSIYSGG